MAAGHSEDQLQLLIGHKELNWSQGYQQGTQIGMHNMQTLCAGKDTMMFHGPSLR